VNSLNIITPYIAKRTTTAYESAYNSTKSSKLHSPLCSQISTTLFPILKFSGSGIPHENLLNTDPLIF